MSNEWLIATGQKDKQYEYELNAITVTRSVWFRIANCSWLQPTVVKKKNGRSFHIRSNLFSTILNDDCAKWNIWNHSSFEDADHRCMLSHGWFNGKAFEHLWVFRFLMNFSAINFSAAAARRPFEGPNFEPAANIADVPIFIPEQRVSNSRPRQPRAKFKRNPVIGSKYVGLQMGRVQNMYIQK